MTPLLSLAGITVAALVAPPAVGAVGAVAIAVVPPVVNNVGDEPRRLEIVGTLNDSVARCLGDRGIRLEARACDPVLDPRCVAAQLGANGSSVGNIVRLSVEGAEHILVVRAHVFGADGQLVDDERAAVAHDAPAVEIGRVADALLARFAPPPSMGRLVVVDLPVGAEAFVGSPQGTRIEPGVALPLPLGAHRVVVMGVAGSAAPVPVDVVVEHERTTEVSVRASARASPRASLTGGADEEERPPVEASGVAPDGATPGYAYAVPIGGVTTGIATAVVAGAVLLVAAENIAEWDRRAKGVTFPRSADDPLCAPDRCGRDDEAAWTSGYGPLGEGAQVGQGARFMMVALSEDNHRRWRAARDLSSGLLLVGVMTAAANAAVLVADWPSSAE